jgi:hypothetical protein
MQAITAFLMSLVEFQTLYNGILYKNYSHRAVCFYICENKSHSSTVAIDTLGGKRNLKMKIKAQQMTFRQDITKYKIYWLTFCCIVHNIFRAITLIYKRVLYIYTNSFKRLQYSNKRIRGRMKNEITCGVFV